MEPTTAELQTAEVRDNIENHNDGIEFEPLFEGEQVTEKDLLGATEEKAETSAPSGEESKEPEKEPEEKAEPEEKKEPEKKEEVKPPPGYVPHEALKQERHKAQSLRAENQSLRAEIEKLKVPAQKEDRFKDFKVKTTEEYKELLEDDSDAAALYLYEYNQYIEHQTSIKSQQDAEKKAKDSEKALIEEGATELERIVPGFYTKDNPETSKLAQFAVDNGFEPGVLYDLTNPATKIITASGEKYVLGPGAAQLVGFIKSNLNALSSVPKEDDLRKTIESDLKPKLEAELQKTLLEKLKTDTGFKSLDAATSSAEKTAKAIHGAVSESDFSKLSELEQAQLLGG